MEIERSWTLNPSKMSSKLWLYLEDRFLGHRVHTTAYLRANDNFEIRVIKKEDLPHPLYYFTVKSGGTLSRQEYEQLIPEWVYEKLYETASGEHIIRKTRYYIEYIDNDKEKYILELDRYQDKNGKFTNKYRLECEFSSEEEANRFKLPPYFADMAVEVTNDNRFKNKNLASNGWPSDYDNLFKKIR